MLLKLAYLGIAQKLGELNDIKFIDWYNEQRVKLGEVHEMDTPVVFIQFLPLQFESEKRRQRSTLGVRLYAMTRNIASSHQGSPDQNSALAHYDFLEKLWNHIEGWQLKLSDVATLDPNQEDCILIQRLTRVALRPDHNQAQTIMTAMDLEGQALDYRTPQNKTTWSVKTELVQQFALPPDVIGG